MAVALVLPGVATGQDGTLPAIELADVARSEGGFILRGEGRAPDGAGHDGGGVGDVNGDGIPDLVVGGKHCPNVCSPFPTYVIFGKPGGDVVELSSVLVGRGGFAILGNTQPNPLEWSVAGAGDVNGDGFADILIGAPGAEPGGRDQAGESYVVFGKSGKDSVDLSRIQASRSGFVIRGVASGDRSGWSVSGAGDVNGDGISDLLIGAPRADPDGRNLAGESHVVFGRAGGETVELSDVQRGQGGFSIRGTELDSQSGSTVAGAGDVNADGLGDLLVGAPDLGSGGNGLPGECYVVFGKTDREPLTILDLQSGRGGFTVQGRAAGDRLGSSASGAADVNGDGLGDVIVGSPFDRGENYRSGVSYVVFGKTDGSAVHVAELEASRGGFSIFGDNPETFSGWSVSGTGDINGDGLGDLIVGAPLANARATTGEAHVVFGKSGAEPVKLLDLRSGQGGFVIRGADDNSRLGWSVSGTGDLNGDGLADIFVGAPGASLAGRKEAGECYVIFGNPGVEPVAAEELRAGRGGFAILGNEKNDRSRMAVSGAGDINADGFADVIIGFPEAHSRARLGAGATYVVFGRPGSEALDIAAAGQGGVAIRGNESGDRSGWSVSGAGDVNEDGLPDLVIGAPTASPGGRLQAGVAFVILGRQPSQDPVELADIFAGKGGFAILGSRALDLVGRSVSGAGDVNGDGFSDIILGAPDAEVAGQRASGKTYIVFGKGANEAVELSSVEAGSGGFALLGQPQSSLGWSVSEAGDVDGDGLDDILTGAFSDGAGVSYLVFGDASGRQNASRMVPLAHDSLSFHGRSGGDMAGWSVSEAGDVNADGLADIVIGAPGADLGGRFDERFGEAYVVFGQAGRKPILLQEAQAGRGGFAIRGSQPGDATGSSVARAGDINGDGLTDILVGAPEADPGGRSYAGETHVVFGHTGRNVVEISNIQAGIGGFSIRGDSPHDRSGSSVSGVGDVDGDGLADDVLIGSFLRAAQYSAQSAAAYLVFGPNIRGKSPFFHRGDADATGVIDITDAVTVFGYLYLGDPAKLPCMEAADVDNDGITAISDGIRILRWLFSDGPEPSPPGPTRLPCGADPDQPGTAGDLGCASYTPCK